MFGFFKKKEEKKQEIIEYITIVNENGNQVDVVKSDWLKNTYEPFISENKDNSEAVLDIIDLALSYGVKEAILQASIEYDRNPNIVSVDKLFKAFVLNGLYKDAARLYEEFGEYNLKSYMYYDLAMVKEKLGDMEAKRKYLYLAFNSNNNNERAVKALLEDVKLNEGEKEYYDTLYALNEESNSYYVSRELAKIQYANMDNEGTNNIVKALNESFSSEKNIKEIAEILLNYNKLNEFENYILPLYNKNTNDEKMHALVLEFYIKDKQFIKCLDLLKELYSLNKHSDLFVKSEEIVLNFRLYEKDYQRYARFVRGIDDPKNNAAKAMISPIYNKILNIKPEEKEYPNVLILPFYLETNGGELNDKVKSIAKSISSFLFDLIYLNSKINIKNFFMYNSLGARIVTNDYTNDYFMKIKEKNDDIEYILTGVISDVDKENLSISFYVFDTSTQTRINLYNAKTNTADINSVIHKFITTTLKDTFAVKFNELKENDTKYIYTYAKFLEILLNVNKENKDKIYTVDKLLKELLENPNEHKLNLALSIVSRVSNDLPMITKSYRQKIYDVMLKEKYMEKMLDRFKIVYGENNDKI